MRKFVPESLFEAKLNLPEDYLKQVRDRAEELYGFSGPSMDEKMEMMNLMGQIMKTQEGNEEELTQIGLDLIRKHYGDIIADVELDVKIVPFDDPEKKEIAQKMTQKENDEEEEEPDTSQDEPEIEDQGRQPSQEQIDQRKIINNVMQGESQNIHSMMYDAKEEVNDIDQNLLDLYMRHLELNKKFDWDENVDLEEMMQNAPEFANVMETDYENEEGDEDEEGQTKPVIRARVVDLPMVLHETVKGIYELIAAGAIPEDAEIARKIMDATDNLKDEQEDIKYGPFIAASIRDFLNEVIEEHNVDIPNLREYIFGRMVSMNAEEFVNLITGILERDSSKKKVISNIIKEIQQEFEEYERKATEYEYGEGEEESTEEPETKERDYSEMSKSELEKLMNQALENDDFETLQKIQPYLKESQKSNVELDKFLKS